ncbi:MAG TPA: ATP-binding cassette domain-containing protein [Streptosporangiaceae bacterium]|nr:ATP-binding cassette domain-containing protein [Streptosporangiaceae bacterium]
MLKADVEVDRRDFTVRAAIEVAPGERLALFGPSGAGKTTLLETIAGLVRPRTGLIELAGRTLTRTATPAVAVPPWQRQVGLLRQDPSLFPHLSVRDNLAYARATDPRGAELTGLADALGIGDLLDAMPARLSGGQQHRAALGRLLLAHCGVLLLDEPYSGLDAVLRRTLTALVVRLATERRVPAVLVAHELTDAQAFANRIAVLDRGVVLQTGAPDQVVLRPAALRVAELVGYLGFVPVAGRPGTVAGIHPDRVVPGTSPARGLVLTGTVAASRPAGAAFEVDLLCPAAVPDNSVAGTGSPGTGPDSTGTDGSGSTGSASPVVTCRLAERPAAEGETLTVTALDPPCFGPDGYAVPWRAGPVPERAAS